MVFELSGFGISLSIFGLPVFDLSFQVAVALLHFGYDLLIFCYFEFIVFVVINFTVEFQFFFL